MIGQTTPTDFLDQFRELARDVARRLADLERAMQLVGGAGAPSGTGSSGQEYWDTTNKRLHRSDGAGGIVMAEPEQTHVTTVTAPVGTITTVGAESFAYKRRDRWLDWYASVAIATAGTAAGTYPIFTFPVCIIAAQSVVGGPVVKAP